MEIKFYARNNELEVAAGFETKERRDAYISKSISNGHPWRICDEEEARSCKCYQNFYEKNTKHF